MNFKDDVENTKEPSLYTLIFSQLYISVNVSINFPGRKNTQISTTGTPTNVIFARYLSPAIQPLLAAIEKQFDIFERHRKYYFSTSLNALKCDAGQENKIIELKRKT